VKPKVVYTDENPAISPKINIYLLFYFTRMSHNS